MVRGGGESRTVPPRRWSRGLGRGGRCQRNLPKQLLWDTLMSRPGLGAAAKCCFANTLVVVSEGPTYGGSKAFP